MAKHNAGLAAGREAKKTSVSLTHQDGVNGLGVTIPALEELGVAANQPVVLQPAARGARDGPVQVAQAYSLIRDYGRSDNSIC